MRRKSILTLGVVWEVLDELVKSRLILMKEIYLHFIMLVVFGGIFVTEVTAQNTLQNKILATAGQSTTDTATQKRIEELIKQLGDENASVRRDAAWNLGRITDSKTFESFIKEAVQPLIKNLADENSGVRAYSAYALGKIRDLRALKPLINALEDSNANVRLFSASALGGLGDTQAKQSLNNLLKDEDARVQKAAAKALKQIEAAVQEVQQEAPPKEQATPEVQVEETEKKQTFEDKSADTQNRIEGFIAQLSDPDVRIHNRAAQHLKAIGQPAKLPLIKVLEDSSPNPPQAVVVILGDIGDVSAIKPLYKVLSEGRTGISRAAGMALGKIKSRVTSEEWDREVQAYRESRYNEMEKEMEEKMAKELERLRSERESRRRTIGRPVRRTPFVPPQTSIVQPPIVEKPSPTVGEGFLLRPRGMSIPVFVILSIMGMAIGSVIMAIFIRLATKVVVRYDIAFGEAWTIAFLIAVITFFVRLMTAFINEPAFYIFSGIAQLGIAPFIYGRMIDYGEGPIGFFKGLLIHICSIVATFVVVFGTIFLCGIILLSAMR